MDLEYQAKSSDIAKQRTDCAVVAIFENGNISASAQILNNNCDNIVRDLIKQEELSGKPGQALWLYHLSGCPALRVLLLGCGAENGCTENDFRTALQKAASEIKGSSAKDATLYLHEVKLRRQLQKGLDTGRGIAAGVALARDLGNQPGNVCTPTFLGKEAKKLARNQSNFTTKVLSEKQLKELGMNALLSVSAGSDEPAQLIIMEYKGGRKTQAPHVLVGKGITFDSGGISLKPGLGMDEMKFDMCGAASVLGTMQALLQLKAAVNVVGIVVACENMPSGGATKPGDIIKSMSGQTIEVLNTDAEGRLVLCDTLTYAERFKPKTVIDVATLTGACVVALGKHASGLYSNREELAQQLLESGRQASDRAWHMPLWDEYHKQLDSNFADMANIGGRDAGSVTAACFLSRFAKNYPWAHLDIAGTAWLSGPQKGATGRPVPLLVQYLINQSGK
ncbi:MAG: leucyl aminopeptidase [Exilibacterium sp.]